MLDNDLNKLKSVSWTTIIFIVTAMLSSGFLFIFLFERNLFLNTGNLKLILLGLAITAPIWLINSAITFEFESLDRKSNEHYHLAAIIGSIISIVTIYFPILLGLFFAITIRIAVGIILILEVIYLIGWLLQRKKNLSKVSVSKV